LVFRVVFGERHDPTEDVKSLVPEFEKCNVAVVEEFFDVLTVGGRSTHRDGMNPPNQGTISLPTSGGRGRSSL
jgi:hypothetical protein